MGMVVRTNTMAINAQRQLNLNNNKVSKSLEKLASGYKINRAGDDGLLNRMMPCGQTESNEPRPIQQ